MYLFILSIHSVKEFDRIHSKLRERRQAPETLTVEMAIVYDEMATARINEGATTKEEKVEFLAMKWSAVINALIMIIFIIIIIIVMILLLLVVLQKQ